MHRKRIGVLRGGPGPLYTQSLASGHSVLQHTTDAVDIFVDKRGVWHIDGVPVRLEEVRDAVDVVINALHGSYGSDGYLQRQLERHHIPYTGAGVTGAAGAYNRMLSKELLQDAGLRVPHGITISIDDTHWKRILQNFFVSHPGPYIVKDTAGHGTSMQATTLTELADCVSKFRSHGRSVIVEEHVPGTESVVGVLDNYRGRRYYTTVPSTGSNSIIEDIAQTAHTALGMRDYSVVHVVDSRRGPFVIKVVAHPELHTDGYFVSALADIGCRYPEFIAHLLRRHT